MTTSVRVGVVPGDDAAPDAVHATLDVVQAMALPVEWVVVDDPDEQSIRRTIGECATVLYGATSGRTGGMAWLRWGLGTYANVRPIRWRPGLPSPR